MRVLNSLHPMGEAGFRLTETALADGKVTAEDCGRWVRTIAEEGRILNLAEAKNLTPARNTYVVWMEGEDNNVTNLGQINTSTHMFSKALKGELNAIATTKPKRVFITAEDDGKVQYPGTQMILQTQ